MVRHVTFQAELRYIRRKLNAEDALTPMSDEILVTTFERLRQRLLRFARDIVRSDDDAQDVLQESFVTLWQHYRDVESQAEAEKLSFRVVRNRSITELRLKAREPKAQDAVLTGDADMADDVTSATEREELLQRVEELMETKLGAQQLTVFRHHDLEGRPVDQIARDMQLTETAVRMNLSRARKKIREIYIKKYAHV